jgi:hypothetical protein
MRQNRPQHKLRPKASRRPTPSYLLPVPPAGKFRIDPRVQTASTVAHRLSPESDHDVRLRMPA